MPDVQLGIGIATGEAIIGPVRAQGSDRTNWAIIGGTVNIALRLQALNKELSTSILCDERTYSLIRDVVIVDTAPGIVVKGIGEPTNVYSICGEEKTGRRDHLWKGEGPRGQ